MSSLTFDKAVSQANTPANFIWETIREFGFFKVASIIVLFSLSGYAMYSLYKYIQTASQVSTFVSGPSAELPYSQSVYTSPNTTYQPMMDQPPGYTDVFRETAYSSTAYPLQSHVKTQHPAECKKNPECYPCAGWKFIGPPHCS
jgi:hypothetical protein